LSDIADVCVWVLDIIESDDGIDVCWQEVMACVKGELKTASMSMFVSECLALTVERSSTARNHTGAMLHHLLRNHILTITNYIDGLHDFLSSADDMVIDIPRIWQYIAELISPMLLDDDSEIPLDFLRRACSPLRSCEGGDKAALVISMVLLDAVHSLVRVHGELSLFLA